MHLRTNLKSSLIALMLPVAASAQVDVFIPAGTTVYYFGNAAIYGNVVNNGSMGSFAGDTLTFYGQSWTNGPNASYPAVAPGGTIAFVQPRPAPYASSVQQTINGQYTSGVGTSFNNLIIDNPNNVALVSSKTRLKENLHFASGKVILNANDLILGSAGGNGGSGTITGYDQNKYVATNGAGHLVKESYIGAYTFPVAVGTGGTSDYAPAKITNNTANGMHVNVATYAATAGVAPRPTANGVNRTWNIYATSFTGSSTVDLQHDTSNNEALFRNSSQYLTRYVGTAPNTLGEEISFDAWEKNHAQPGIMPGTLTTGAPIATASELPHVWTSFATNPTENNSFYTKASGPLCLNARAYLEGALVANSNATGSTGRPLMRDNLRNSPFTGANYIPVKNPYQNATTFVDVTGKYSIVGAQATNPALGQVIDSQDVFSVTGENAIVDWVFIELRNKANAATVAATRAALIQRDGDIVEVDGKSCLQFPGLAVDSYYVAVRHRSHLGAMTASARDAAQMEGLVDMSVTTTPMYDKGVVGAFNYAGLATNNGVKSGYRALWQGDFDANRKVKYAAPNDDNNVLLGEVLGHPGNTALALGYDFAFGYYQGDYDMNSKAKFAAPNDDQNLLLGTILGYPLNTALATGFDFMIEQLP